MMATRGELRLLPERQQPMRIGKRSVDPDQRFGANGTATEHAEQRVTGLDAPHLHGGERVNYAFDELRFDLFDRRPLGTKALRTDDERYRRRINCEDFRPASRDHVEQSIDRRSLDRLQYCLVDRRHGAGMTPSKGDQILIRLFGCSKASPQAGHCLLLERNDLAHEQPTNREQVNFLWRAGETAGIFESLC